MSQDNLSIGSKFENLVQIMSQLRGPEGCPWDREQTHQSLRQYLLEETYEVLERIDDGNLAELKNELGDLLLQTIFHAQISSENDGFDISDIIDGITDKLIRRHPNVFGDADIKSAEEQSINWEKIKKAEGKESVIDGVPKALSALLRAYRIQQKASTVGFDWPDKEPVWEKVREELQELADATTEENFEHIEEEFGDLIFSLVNLARFLKINPEDAVRGTTEKFIRRFKEVEQVFDSEKKSMSEATLEELDEVWEKVKAEEKS